MKTLICALFLFMASLQLFSQGYKIGDVAEDFKLKNVDQKMVSLADYKEAKGFVVVFTCNHCPFAKAYQERIQTINSEYKPKGYPVIAISPNDPNIVPEDSFDEMIKLASGKSFTYPYLFDETQEVYKKYGATRTPHVFLLQKDSKGKYIVKYIGAIDDNYQEPSAVKEKYLSNAIDALLAGNQPNPDFTKAIGCTIKDKSAIKN